MVLRMVLILMIILTFTLLFANEDNILKLDDSKLYFSINSTINSKYITEYSRYVKTLKSYHHKKNEEIGNKIPPRFVKIDLPDSLVGYNLRIKKGFQVIKIDSTRSIPFVINKFELDFWCANSRIVINFNNPDKLDPNKQNLFIIAENEKILKEINPFSPEICKDSEINHRINELIVNYFYKNREELNRQLTYLYPIADSITDDKLKKEIASKFNLIIYNLNKTHYCVIGTSNEYEHNKFFAIINPNSEIVIMKTHTIFYQTFNIINEYYFFCNSYLPYTGGNTFWVYKLKEDKLEPIFIDSSFST